MFASAVIGIEYYMSVSHASNSKGFRKQSPPIASVLTGSTSIATQILQRKEELCIIYHVVSVVPRHSPFSILAPPFIPIVSLTLVISKVSFVATPTSIGIIYI
jgi:hypothetical protein